MPIRDEKDAEGRVSRADQVRKAFNCPILPFVSRHIGRPGGLDFHTYCHAVMHWNLPAIRGYGAAGGTHPPYKGHAVGSMLPAARSAAGGRSPR